jgi:hypothetical protein
MTPTAPALLARAARGSMRDGLSLADQAIAFGGGVLTRDTVRTMLGSVDAVRRTLRAGCVNGAGWSTADALRALGLAAARLRRWPRCCSRWRSAGAGALPATPTARAPPRGVLPR